MENEPQKSTGKLVVRRAKSYTLSNVRTALFAKRVKEKKCLLDDDDDSLNYW